MAEATMDDIREVVETGMGRANRYLEHGYRLLGVTYATRLEKVTEDVKGMTQSHHVARHTVYVLGRPADVAAYEEPPARAPQPEAAAAS